MWDLAEWCSALVGVIFIFSSTQKLIDWRGWLTQAGQLGVGRALASFVAPVEGVVGLSLVTQLWSRAALVASLVLLVAFTALLVSLLVRGRRPACACFGSARTRPISWFTVTRNVALIAVNIAALLGMTS